MPLRSVYPECLVHIEPHPQLYPLQCFRTSCPANKNCAEIIARRVNYLFTMVMPQAEMLILYYKYRDRPKSIRAGVFMRDLQEPRQMIVNPYAFKKFQKGGITYEWFPKDEFLFMGSEKDLVHVDIEVTRP